MNIIRNVRNYIINMNVLSILLIFYMNNCDNRYKKGCLNLSVFQIYVTVCIL